MTSINVPAAWVGAGHLPPRCVKHGTPATQWNKRTFYSSSPWWLIILIPFTLLVVLIVALVMRKTVEGPIPSCDACVTDYQRFRKRVMAGWAIDLLLIVAAALLKSGALGLVWLVWTVAVLVETFRGDAYRARGVVSQDGIWVDPSRSLAVSPRR